MGVRYKIEFIVERPEDEGMGDTAERIRDWLETDLDYNNTGDCYQDLVVGMGKISITIIDY